MQCTCSMLINVKVRRLIGNIVGYADCIGAELFMVEPDL